MPISEVTNEDCMVMMARYPDRFFDLAIVDPPYGVGDFVMSDRKTKHKKHLSVNWNNYTPDKSYFNELARISKKQIIWGANYYNCFASNGGALVWYKEQTHPTMSSCEIASLSFQKKVDFFHYQFAGFLGADKDNFHPCGKPYVLYSFILNKYAQIGDKILDTHLGSGSHRIAAYKLGFDFWASEIDKDYFDAQEKRFQQAINEPLFQTIPEKPEQKELF